MVVSTRTAEHYKWGECCDGWVLASGKDLLVIEEFMPAGTCELRHYHSQSRQFFYVLFGRLTMEMDGQRFEIPVRQGIEVPPGVPHQARNDSRTGVSFLVVSSPTSRGDRLETSPVQVQ